MDAIDRKRRRLEKLELKAKRGKGGGAKASPPEGRDPGGSPGPGARAEGSPAPSAAPRAASGGPGSSRTAPKAPIAALSTPPAGGAAARTAAGAKTPRAAGGAAARAPASPLALSPASPALQRPSRSPPLPGPSPPPFATRSSPPATSSARASLGFTFAPPGAAAGAQGRDFAALTSLGLPAAPLEALGIAPPGSRQRRERLFGDAAAGASSAPSSDALPPVRALLSELASTQGRAGARAVNEVAGIGTVVVALDNPVNAGKAIRGNRAKGRGAAGGAARAATARGAGGAAAGAAAARPRSNSWCKVHVSAGAPSARGAAADKGEATANEGRPGDAAVGPPPNAPPASAPTAEPRARLELAHLAARSLHRSWLPLFWASLGSPPCPHLPPAALPQLVPPRLELVGSAMRVASCPGARHLEGRGVVVLRASPGGLLVSPEPARPTERVGKASERAVAGSDASAGPSAPAKADASAGPSAPAKADASAGPSAPAKAEAPGAPHARTKANASAAPRRAAGDRLSLLPLRGAELELPCGADSATLLGDGLLAALGGAAPGKRRKRARAGKRKKRAT